MRGSFLHRVSLVPFRIKAFMRTLFCILRRNQSAIPAQTALLRSASHQNLARKRSALSLLSVSCLGTLLILMFFISQSHAADGVGGNVALLLSGPEEAYAVSAEAFKAEVNLPFRTFTLSGEDKNFSAIKTQLFASKPSIIFALGAKAAFLAKAWTKTQPEIPVVFAMVLNWKRYDLLKGQDNISGIATETSVGTQFVNLTTIVPKTSKIGVVYSEEFSASLIAEAKETAALLGLELVAEPITSPFEFQRAYKKISDKVDSFWVLNDPVTFTLSNMDWLAQRCIKDRIVCLGQSENVAKQGLTLAVNADFHDIGAQAASLIKNILRGNQSPADIGVMDPLGTEIHINLRATERMELQLSASALNMATKIFDK